MNTQKCNRDINDCWATTTVTVCLISALDILKNYNYQLLSFLPSITVKCSYLLIVVLLIFPIHCYAVDRMKNLCIEVFSMKEYNYVDDVTGKGCASLDFFIKIKFHDNFVHCFSQ